jgi:hypothetical protein
MYSPVLLLRPLTLSCALRFYVFIRSNYIVSVMYMQASLIRLRFSLIDSLQQRHGGNAPETISRPNQAKPMYRETEGHCRIGCLVTQQEGSMCYINNSYVN